MCPPFTREEFDLLYFSFDFKRNEQLVKVKVLIITWMRFLVILGSGWGGEETKLKRKRKRKRKSN